MTDPANIRPSLEIRWLLRILSLLAIVCLLFAFAAQAAPPIGKGGGKGGGGGGGGGGGSTPQPELHLKWRVLMDAAYSLVRPAVGPDGTVYAVDVAKNLVAVASNGTVLWTATDAGSKGVDVGPDGTVYTGTEDWIKAYNPDGSLKWTFVQTPRAFVLIDVAVGPDGNVYAVASSGMGVFSLADTPGGPVLRWTNPEAYQRNFVGYTELAFGPTADGSDDQLYFYANAHTRAVRLSDGTSVFSTGGNNTRPQVSPLDGSWHKGDAAFSPNNDPLWNFQFPLFAGFSEPSIAPDGTHYVVSAGQNLYAIDPFGVEEWHSQLSEFVGLPDVSPVDPMVILPTGGSQTHPAALLAVGTPGGNDLWRMEFPPDGSGLDQFIGSGVAYSADGMTAYVMTAVSSGGGVTNTYLNAVDTDPGLPNASTVLRSADVTLDVRKKRGQVSFTGLVNVMDENKGPISGATVAATWTLPDGSTLQQTATTSGTGVAKFNITGPGGTYRIDVTDISLEGFAFDPEHSLLFAARAWF